MRKIGAKKIITLKAKISREEISTIEVNPSVRLTAVQSLVDDYVSALLAANPGCVVEVSAEGLL